jgi:hypothetical protein
VQNIKSEYAASIFGIKVKVVPIVKGNCDKKYYDGSDVKSETGLIVAGNTVCVHRELSCLWTSVI